MGMLVFEEWGGLVIGNLVYVLVLEEILVVDGVILVIMSVYNLVGCVLILKFGIEV